MTSAARDPATLARDLAGLTAAGYHVEKMTLVDLFPQTFHLETAVGLGGRSRVCFAWWIRSSWLPHTSRNLTDGIMIFGRRGQDEMWIVQAR